MNSFRDDHRIDGGQSTRSHLVMETVPPGRGGGGTSIREIMGMVKPGPAQLRASCSPALTPAQI